MSSVRTVIEPKWYSVDEVALMLGFGKSKTKNLIATGRLKSVKDGRNRKIIARWVDEYVESRIAEVEGADR